MNIINKITLRFLRANMRRTFVTIVGAVIATAMLTAVASLFVAFFDLMQRDYINRNGLWHAQYEAATMEQIEKAAADASIADVLLKQELGYALWENSNLRKPYLYFEGYNEAAMANFNLQLKSGRLPINDGEIVISEEAYHNGFPYALGDKITFNLNERHYNNGTNEALLGQEQTVLYNAEGDFEEFLVPIGEREFTIVGTIARPVSEYTNSPGYSAITRIDETAVKEGSLSVFVVFSEINRKIFQQGEDLTRRIDAKVYFNQGLLRCYGLFYDDQLNTTLYTFGGILIVIIMVGAILLIYNAFAISVAQRTRYLGLLASVGATKRQKRNSVFFEGVVIGAISIPLGIIGGLLGISITFWFINPMIVTLVSETEKLSLVITPQLILTSAMLSMFTIFISAYVPAYRASHVSAIDAIKQSKEIKLTKKKIKTAKIVKKIFGFEGELAIKNLKRNRGRYYATLFSLIISIVLFISVAGFTAYLEKSIAMTTDSLGFDLLIDDQMGNDESKKALTEIASFDGVTDSTRLTYHYYDAALKDEQLSEHYQRQKDPEQDNYLVGVPMHSLDKQSLQAYAQKIGVNFADLTNTNKPAAIIIGTMIFRSDASTYEEYPSIIARKGDTVDLIYALNSDKQSNLPAITVAAITDELPMGVANKGDNMIMMIVSEEVQQYYQKLGPQELNQVLYLSSDDPMALDKEITKWLSDNAVSYFTVNNFYEYRLNDEYLLSIMKVFSGGFITLITLIAIANIFNTISTGISLRRQEFAMLKSVGMTQQSFYQMIRFESLFYGLKALLYGLPISFVILWLMFKTIMTNFNFGFILPWKSILLVIVAIILIIALTMRYAFGKVKDQNIVDGLKQENL